MCQHEIDHKLYLRTFDDLFKHGEGKCYRCEREICGSYRFRVSQNIGIQAFSIFSHENEAKEDDVDRRTSQEVMYNINKKLMVLLK